MVVDKLFELQDKEYAKFQANLTPTMDSSSIIGVRVPLLRNYAKEIKKTQIEREFLQELPHQYYDENMLHSILLSMHTDFDSTIAEVSDFLPYIDNWAVCDTLKPKAFAKKKDILLEYCKEWMKSNEIYTIRFGIGTLHNFFLGEDFNPVHLQWVSKVVSDEYYVNMMIAWYFATALGRFWEDTIPYLENNVLSKWVHNKTIQKGVESFCITEEQKSYLRSLRQK